MTPSQHVFPTGRFDVTAWTDDGETSPTVRYEQQGASHSYCYWLKILSN
jgi:hypothetical protein